VSSKNGRKMARSKKEAQLIELGFFLELPEDENGG
jgi:hypothetical protein